MSSNIILTLNNPNRPYDSEYPRKGLSQPSQQFRDNFRNIEEAFYEANAEIDGLLSDVSTINTNLNTLTNSFSNKTIQVNGDFSFTSNPFGNNSDPITLTLTMNNLLPNTVSVDTSVSDLNISVNEKGLVTSMSSVAVSNNVDTSRSYGIDITSVGSGTGTMVLPNMTFDSKGRLKAITDVSVSYGLFNHTLPKFSLVVGSDSGSMQLTAPTPNANDYYLGLDSSTPSGFAWKQLNISGFGYLTTVSSETGLKSSVISATETRISLDVPALTALNYLTLYDTDEFIVYSNDVNDHRKISWADMKTSIQGNFITKVEEDLAPKLGGNLDLNNKNIFSSGPINITSGSDIILNSSDPNKGVSVGNNFLADNNASFGDDMTIGENLSVGTNANIGDYLVIGSNSTIGDNSNIGSNSTIGMNANIGENLIVGNGMSVGNNASFLNNTSFGDNTSFGLNTSISGMLWPNIDGDAGQVLTTDGLGTLYWSTPSTGGGSITSVTVPYTIFVSQNGDDATGDGSLTTPVKTIAQAVSMVPNGDTNKWTVVLLDGSFDEEININNKKNIGFESASKSNKTIITGNITLGFAIDNFEMENIIFDKTTDTSQNPAFATSIDVVNMKIVDCEFLSGNTIADMEKPIIQLGGNFVGTVEFINCGIQGKVTNVSSSTSPVKFIGNRNIGEVLPSFELMSGSSTFINGFEKIGYIKHFGGKLFVENVNGFSSLTETMTITYPAIYQFDHVNYVPILELVGGLPVRIEVNGETEDEFGDPYTEEVLDENGDEVLAKDGSGNYIPVLDEFGDPVLDEFGDPVYEVMTTMYVQAYTQQPDDIITYSYGIKSESEDSDLLTLKNISLFNETDYSPIYKTGSCPWKFINVDRRPDYDTINGPRTNFETNVDSGEFTPVLFHDGTKLIYRDSNIDVPNNRLDSYRSKSFYVTLESDAAIDILGHNADFNPNGTLNSDRTIQEIEVIVRQDSIGGRTLTFNGLFEESQAINSNNIIWVGDSNPISDPDSITVYTFKFVSGHNFWIAGKSLGGSGNIIPPPIEKVILKDQTILDNSSLVIDPSDITMFNETVDPHEIMVEVTVKDENPSSTTYNSFLPATMVATVAKNDTHITIFNETSNPLVFNIILKK